MPPSTCLASTVMSSYSPASRRAFTSRAQAAGSYSEPGLTSQRAVTSDTLTSPTRELRAETFTTLAACSCKAAASRAEAVSNLFMFSFRCQNIIQLDAKHPHPNITGATCQILRAYSATARSELKRPERAMLTSDMCPHFSVSRYVESTLSCASEYERRSASSI